jgi:hypothetical protein
MATQRSTNAEIAAAYKQQSSAGARLQEDFRSRVKADGPGVEQAVAAVMGGMDLYEAAAKFRVEPAQVHKRTNYAREMGFSLDPSVQSRVDWMTERDTNRAADFAGRTDTAVGEGGERYRLVNRPDGQQIYDTQSGAMFTMNMATPEMLQAVGMGDRPSTRPADAATLPGQTAPPVVNGAVQNGVQGNPTQAERDLGTVSTLPGGATRPPFTPPPTAATPPAASVQPQPQERRFALPSMRMPTNVDYTGSAGSIFGNYVGTAPAGGFAAPSPQAQSSGFQPPAGVNVTMRDSGIPQSGGGTTMRALSSTTGGFEAPSPAPGEGETLPSGVDAGPDPWPGPGGGGASGGADTTTPAAPTSAAPQAPTGYVYVPKYGTDSLGRPTSTWELVPDRTPQPSQPPQRAPQTADEIRQTQLENDRIRAETDRIRNQPIQQQRDPNLPAPMHPEQLDAILASTGMTNEQIARMKALLPGEINLQNANVDQIRAGIENAAARLGLDTTRFDWQRIMDTAQTEMGYANSRRADAQLGLSQQELQLRAELGYADSRRADAQLGLSRSGVSGYMDNGDPTLQREQLISDSERQNLLAQASVGNMAAQVRLREIDQAETARQFNTTTEMAWRQNPSSLFDRVWDNRGGASAASGFQAPQPQQAQAQMQQQPQQAFAPPQAQMQQQAQAQPQQAAFQAPQAQQQQRSALSYGEIQRAGAEPPAVAAATRGDNMTAAPRWRPAGDMPVVSGQALGQLSGSERSVFDAQLRATGNDPNDYHAYRQRMTAAPVRSGGFAAPRRVGASL